MKVKFFKEVARHKTLIIMALPAIIWYGLFAYAPMFGLVIAFKDFDYVRGIFGSDWIWFENFEILFKSTDAWLITRNSIFYNLVWIPLGITLSVTLAIMYNSLHTKRRAIANKVNQTLSIMPYFLSWVVVSYFAESILNTDKGFLNRLITLFGADQINWYSEPKYWPYILTIVNLWKGLGYSAIIYYSTIRGFNTEYYEAAWIDGASWFQQIWHITLPLLRPIITIMFTLAMGGILGSDFGLFYMIPKNSGMLYSTTSTIDTYIYNGMMSGGELGMIGAVSFYKSIVGFVLVLVTNAIVRKYSYENSLF
jgi:putative aldouronate transport system permease protein